MIDTDNILFFSTCVINKVEIQKDIFLVYLKNNDSIFSLKKTEDNFRKIVIQFQKQYEENLDNEIIRIFEDSFSNKKSGNKKILPLRYVLIGSKHSQTLQYANFSNIHETDLVSTEIIYKDRKLCKSLKKRFCELKKNLKDGKVII